MDTSDRNIEIPLDEARVSLVYQSKRSHRSRRAFRYRFRSTANVQWENASVHVWFADGRFRQAHIRISADDARRLADALIRVLHGDRL